MLRTHIEVRAVLVHFILISISSFFLNQQFITRGARADRGSYFVTTYIQTEAT